MTEIALIRDLFGEWEAQGFLLPSIYICTYIEGSAEVLEYIWFPEEPAIDVALYFHVFLCIIN